MLIRQSFLAAGLIATGMMGASAQTVILQPDDEVVVREYVVKQPHQDVVVPDGYSVMVGEPVPDTITVSPLDAPGFEKEYEYVVIDGQTVIVDPATRNVVQVLD